MDMLFCHSCHIKQSAENPITLYQQAEKRLCQRCITLQTVYIATTSDIFGDKPDRHVMPLFKEAVFTVPPQQTPMITGYMEPYKIQLMLASREQTLQEKGNAIVDAKFTLTRLENLHFLLAFSGTMVFSQKWDEVVRQIPAPNPVPYISLAAETAEGEANAVLRDAEEENRVAGKYPDVGGSGAQMNKFKQLVGNHNPSR